MERWVNKVLALFVMWALMLLVTLVPFLLVAAIRRKGAKGLALLVTLTCFTGGIFLGTCLVILLPEVTSLIGDSLLRPNSIEYPVAELIVGLGFFAVMFAEKAIHVFQARGRKRAREKMLTTYVVKEEDSESKIRNGNENNNKNKNKNNALSINGGHDTSFMLPQTHSASLNGPQLLQPQQLEQPKLQQQQQLQQLKQQEQHNHCRKQQQALDKEDEKEQQVQQQQRQQQATKGNDGHSTDVVELDDEDRIGDTVERECCQQWVTDATEGISRCNAQIPCKQNVVKSTQSSHDNDDDNDQKYPDSVVIKLLTTPTKAPTMTSAGVDEERNLPESQHLPACQETAAQPSEKEKQGDPDRQSIGMEVGALEEATGGSSAKMLILLMALSLDCVLGGLSLGLQRTVGTVWSMLFGICAHETIVGFSLGVQLSSSKAVPRSVALGLAIGYASFGPLGVLIGTLIIETSDTTPATNIINGILQGIATGVFIYVTFFELLGEGRVGGQTKLSDLIAIFFGFAVMAAIVAIMLSFGGEGNEEEILRLLSKNCTGVPN